MKVKCSDCGRSNSSDKETLILVGWAHAEGQMNNQKFNFTLCPVHNTAERVFELTPKPSSRFNKKGEEK